MAEIAERALQAAIMAYLNIHRSATIVDAAMAAAIEAYEAARWRPIEEAPRDGSSILISRNDGIPAVVSWSERHNGVWEDRHRTVYVVKSNTMFRTTDGLFGNMSSPEIPAPKHKPGD